MHKGIRITLILVLFLCLVGIRMYAESLFYDPLIDFFKGDYKTQSLPAFSISKLILGISFRFGLNTLISLGILWFWFQKTSIVKFSLLLYLIVFAVLLLLFIILVMNAEGNYMVLFYVRRFLIQPILVLLLIPAFYFQKKYD